MEVSIKNTGVNLIRDIEGARGENIWSVNYAGEKLYWRKFWFSKYMKIK